MAKPIQVTEHLDLYGLGTAINGDNVIGFTSPTIVKTQGWADNAKVMTYIMNEDDEMSHRKHLGLVQLFQTTHEESMPMMMDTLNTASVMEVPIGGSVTYDLPISRDTECTKTMADTSNQGAYIGRGETPFYVVLNREFTANDILTPDATSEFQARVSADHPVESDGENYKTYLIFTSRDKNKDFPKVYLTAGMEWMKTGHFLGEMSTQWSSPSMEMSAPGFITNQWMLGSPQGIETFYTRDAGNMRSKGMKGLAAQTLDTLQNKMIQMGGYEKRGSYFTGLQMEAGGGISGIKIGNTLEYLAIMELLVMESWSGMFARAAEYESGDGVIRITEGVWPQMRRGKIITYSKPGGLTLSHLQDASQYVFKNSRVPTTERILKFKGGDQAVQNGLALIKAHAVNDLNSFPSILTGTMGQFPQSIVTGTDLMNLTVGTAMFTKGNLPGVGWVSFEHDPSFDYNPAGNRITSGFAGKGFHKTTFSLMLDARDTNQSNLYDKVRGAKLVADGNRMSNLYYIKPEGGHLTWGRSQGRMNQDTQYTNISSAIRYMGNEFWGTVQSGFLMLDTTATIIIELQDTYGV